MKTPAGTARAENPARKRLVLSEEVEAVPMPQYLAVAMRTKHSNNTLYREQTNKNRTNLIKNSLGLTSVDKL
ncbi:hypothetical protein [Sediminibacillus terrae]|uniref:hypothetical protein n=1 Tax=Sediminibacillus terrae TaxID=1562106 RepID=UPI00047AC87A|nr:hypothetical protein [Sediminibacillus terrae]